MRILTLTFFYYSCVCYSLFNPIFGLLFFIHITIFRPESLVWGNIVFGRLHFLTALAVLCGYLLNKKKFDRKITKGHQYKNIIFFIFFLMWLSIVSTIADHSKIISFNNTIELLKIFIICFLFAKLINSKQLIQAYIWVVAISFGGLAYWGTLQGLAGNPRLDTLWPGGSNYIAAQFALIAPLVLAKAMESGLSIKYKIILVFCVASMAICTIFTYSRGGFLGLVIGIFVLLMTMKQRLRLLLWIGLIGLALSPWIPASFTDRISSVFVPTEERDVSAGVRPVLWQIAGRIWSDHPIAGVGLGNFSPIKETYVYKVSDIVTSKEMHEHIFGVTRFTHGLYQGMAAEAGTIGLLLYLLLLGRNVLCRFPKSLLITPAQQSLYQQARGAQAGLIGFSAAAVFGDFQYIETLYLQMFFIGAVREQIEWSGREAS